MFPNLNFEIVNNIISALSFILAVYSIHYTRKQNRRRIHIVDCFFHIDKTGTNPPIAWFKIQNLSPLFVTLCTVEFFDSHGSPIQPISHKTIQTYECDLSPICGRYDKKVELSYLDYEKILNPTCPLLPYESLELGYRFTNVHKNITIKVTCAEPIHRFRKHQSFFRVFSQDIQ